MRLVLCTTLVGLALATAPGAVLAGEGCDGFDPATHVFDMSDRDGDGYLSRQEYTDAGLERFGVPFAEYDANGDGQASLDEYLDLYDRYHPAADGIES